MPINETQLNGRIATLLDRMNRRWNALGETQGVFVGSQRQPDVLVLQTGRQTSRPRERVPARELRWKPTRWRGSVSRWISEVVGLKGDINAVVALKSPLELNRCP